MKERGTEIADGTLDAPLLVTPTDRCRTRLETVVGGEREHRRMEADRIAAALEHRGFQIVVEADFRHTSKEGICAYVPLEEAREALVEEEAHEDHPRVAEHHDEGGQPPLAAFDRPCPEAAPVDLRLLARQRPQLEVGLGCAPWAQQGHSVPEVVLASPIASSAHHPVQHTRRQLGVSLEGVAYERDEAVDDRPSAFSLNVQTMPFERTCHGGMVHTQVTRDGAPLPAFHGEETDDLSSDLGPDHGRLHDVGGSLSEENRLR